MSPEASLVSVRGLNRIFDVSKPWLNRVIERRSKALLTAVSDVSFEIPEKTVYALVGESGSGKSTIGKMLVGLLPPSGGAVTIRGVDLSRETDAAKVDDVRADIQMIFQDPFASLNPRWRVRDIIAEPVAARGGDTSGLAEKLLEQVGLSARDAGKFPHEFSGGQRQQAQVLNLMSDLKDDLGLTYLFISHDLTVVQHMADRIGVLYLGRLVEEAGPEELFDNPKHPYTQMLLAAAPKRCPLASAQCSAERPEMREIRGARVACHLAE